MDLSSPATAMLATDPDRQRRLFGSDGLLPLWIAEPYVQLSPEIQARMRDRADLGWYGYETRPKSVIGSFWSWMQDRHSWRDDSLVTSVSPSIGTSIAVLIEQFTEPGDGVILQPPVFTDFKPLVVRAGRSVVRNSLVLGDEHYDMDLEGLEEAAAHPTTRFMILCNPHNPVGRAWGREELAAVATISAANDVFLLVDEIHADLVLAPHSFVPFAVAAEGSGVRWAATHGPIKTFGLAGVCDTLLITDDEEAADRFRSESSRLHLTRNNVFGVAAFETAYREGGPWLDAFLAAVSDNVQTLRDGLPNDIALVDPQATYLAWLDFRQLGLDVPELASWLAEAGLALSPGHWFGREGAGFARMTIAAPPEMIARAIDLLTKAPR
ncbi:MAG: aminotransferase class I/II-fold pyridoxal phosphate-dependent enzyme [Acidimicrobiia bacterium]|nr:aminotransferase class I/II-fold pyridoxal phosphate-dependent enzyme [Acidimicrobiia bacterium]